MPEQRIYRHILVRHEGACMSPSCTRRFKPGDLVMWSQGSYLWCLTCPAPEMPAVVEESDEQSLTRLDAWMDRKVEEEAERKRESLPVGSKANPAQPCPGHTTPAGEAPISDNITSDPRFQDAF